MKLKTIAVLFAVCMIAGCTKDKDPEPAPQEPISSTSSAASKPKEDDTKPAKNIGDMTLNEIAEEIEKIPPEAMEDMMSSIAEDMEREAEQERETASYAEFPVFDPNSYDYDIKGGDWDYDPLEDHEMQNMPEIPSAFVPE